MALVIGPGECETGILMPGQNYPEGSFGYEGGGEEPRTPVHTYAAILGGIAALVYLGTQIVKKKSTRTTRKALR